MVCPKCGMKNVDGEQFCKSCNAHLPAATESAFDPASAFKVPGALDSKEVSASTRRDPSPEPEVRTKTHGTRTSILQAANTLFAGSGKDKKTSGTGKKKGFHPDSKAAKILSYLQNDMKELLNELSGE